jgi:hypothetical protein
MPDTKISRKAVFDRFAKRIRRADFAGASEFMTRRADADTRSVERRRVAGRIGRLDGSKS